VRSVRAALGCAHFDRRGRRAASPRRTRCCRQPCRCAHARTAARGGRDARAMSR
jgi:hypothetical protein